jgi:tetratricopeptide (TPR) repeat protein
MGAVNIPFARNRPLRAAAWALLGLAAFACGSLLARPDAASGNRRLMERATLALDAGRPAEARVLLERLAKEQPDELLVLSTLGLAMQQLEDWPAELAVGERLFRLAPENPLTCLNLMLPLEMLGRYDEALAAYRRCAVLDPDNIEGLFNFGMFLERRGRYAEAVEVYRRLARSPAFLGPRLAIARVRLRQGRPADAEAEVRAVLRVSPMSSGALDLGVSTAEAVGDLRESRRRRLLLPAALEREQHK